MSESLFITGGAGYLGKLLLPELPRDRWKDITLLCRIRPDVVPEGVHLVLGDLLDPKSYESEIPEGAHILHMAALTGKGRRAEHLRSSLEGTQNILGAARSRNAQGFTFVSSVAAAFNDRPGYHYAEGKVLAEREVSSSGLPFRIVRPTMIFGKDAPVLVGLSKLASAPIVPVFGGGDVKCQPVWGEDLARWMARVLSDQPFDSTTWTVGGPDSLTMRELLQTMRERLKGKSGGLMSFPLSITRGLLRLVEGPLMPWMPLTSGQLASFANDSTADGLNSLPHADLLTTRVDEMMNLAFPRLT